MAGTKPCPICDRVGGPRVVCTVCNMPKKPLGRSVALEMANGMCDSDCSGYFADPRPSELWPGERYGDSLGHMDWHDGLMIECLGDDCPNPHVSYHDPKDAIAVWNRRARLDAGERKDACREEICPCANHLKPSDSMWCPGCGEVHTSGHYDSCACDHCRPRPAERADEAKSGMSEARREALRQMCERLARLHGGEQHGSLSDPEFPEEGSIDLGELRALLDSRGTDDENKSTNGGAL